jgi:hypothetical protein
MSIIQLALGFGLGMGFLAIVHEVCRWDRERRVAGQLGAAAAAPAAEPARGRHRSDDTLGIASNAFAAGLAARDTGPVSADPADYGWQRPSTMIPMPQDVPVWQETWAPEDLDDEAGVPA